jgi:hypothetical protein
MSEILCCAGARWCEFILMEQIRQLLRVSRAHEVPRRFEDRCGIGRRSVGELVGIHRAWSVPAVHDVTQSTTHTNSSALADIVIVDSPRGDYEDISSGTGPR